MNPDVPAADANDEVIAEIIFDRFNHSAEAVDRAYELLYERGYSDPEEVY